MRLRKLTGMRSAGMARRRSFILLEVTISLIVLALTIAAIMRSFTVSMAGIRKAEVTTTAAFLAQQLLEQYEIKAPEETSLEGEFGDSYPNFHYMARFRDVQINYKDVTLESLIEDFVALKEATIDIYYDDRRLKRFRAIHVVTYLMGDEKFTYKSKMLNKLY